MPLGVFVPARASDLSLSFQSAVDTAAQGALFYRDATPKWNALAAGTSGQFLQTQGAGANPVWASLPATDYSPAVILSPASSTRNVIQPTGDASVALTLTGHSATQSAPLLQQKDAAGNLLTSLDPNGQLNLGLGAPPVQNLFLRNDSRNGDNYITCVDSFTHMTQLQLGAGGGGVIVQVNCVDPNDVLFFAVGAPAGQIAPLIQFGTIDPTNSFFLRQFNVLPDASVTFSQNTSTTALRQQASLVPSWAASTDASRQGRLSLTAADALSQAREFLRGEADGTAPRIGFLGAAAVARQSVGAAATDAASTQTLANNIRSALIAFGLAS